MVPLKRRKEDPYSRLKPNPTVKGHVHLMQDMHGILDSKAKAEDDDESQEVNLFGFNAKESKVLSEGAQDPFKGLMVVYPVGRHICFRSLSGNAMRVLKLPNEVRQVQALALSNSKDKLAVAV